MPYPVNPQCRRGHPFDGYRAKVNGGVQQTCSLCDALRRDANRERNALSARMAYRRGGASARRQSRERVAVVRGVRYPMIAQIKLERGCIDCGYNVNHVALQFDHRDPTTKRFGIARGLTYSWDVILEEIAKCDVRCANCHAIRSVNEGHLGRPRVDQGFAVPYGNLPVSPL